MRGANGTMRVPGGITPPALGSEHVCSPAGTALLLTAGLPTAPPSSPLPLVVPPHEPLAVPRGLPPIFHLLLSVHGPTPRPCHSTRREAPGTDSWQSRAAPGCEGFTITMCLNARCSTYTHPQGHTSSGPLPRWLQRPGLGQTEASCGEPLLGLPRRYSSPSTWVIH